MLLRSVTHVKVVCNVCLCLYCRYNGGEGYVPGTLFKRFDKRQATVYVKKVFTLTNALVISSKFLIHLW